MAAAVGDHVDEPGLIRTMLAEDVPAQVLQLNPLARRSACLPGAGEAVLIANDAVDLLRGKAGKFLRRGAGTVKAQGRGFADLRLVSRETAVGVPRVEHGKKAGDAIACQAELGLRLVLLL